MAVCRSDDGEPFVAIKPICDRLGLAWEPQRRRLSADKDRWVPTIRLVPSAGGEQETVCLPVNRVAAWLFSIQVNKVAEHLREPLTRYQNEAADVLDRHFRLRREHASEEVEVLREMLRRSHGHLMAAMPRWAKIRVLHDAGLWHSAAATRLNMPWATFSSHVAEMQRCGLLPAGEWRAGFQDDTVFGRIDQLRFENERLREQLATAKLETLEARQSAIAPPEEEDGTEG